FKLEDQMPGAALVCTIGRSLFQNSAESYPARCYPNAPDTASAQPVEITAGQSARVDFTLEPVRSYTISGAVAGAQGNVAVWLQEENSPQPFAGAPVSPRTGQFILRSIPNGTWRLHVQQMGNAEGRPLTADEEITVNGADVKG